MNFHIYKAMQKAGNTENRPEELLAYEIIKTHLKSMVDINKQKIVWFNDINYAKLDIEFILRSRQKYALRLQGPIHFTSDKAISHDRMQELHLQERGYIVIDFKYKKMPYLWLRNERKLDSIELENAFVEIKQRLKQFGLYFKAFAPETISQE